MLLYSKHHTFFHFPHYRFFRNFFFSLPETFFRIVKRNNSPQQERTALNYNSEPGGQTNRNRPNPQGYYKAFANRVAVEHLFTNRFRNIESYLSCNPQGNFISIKPDI